MWRYRRIGLATTAFVVIALLLSGGGAAKVGAQVTRGQLTINGPIFQNLRFCVGEQICEVGDVDGDNDADLIVFVRNTLGRARAGEVWVALREGSGFSKPTLWPKRFCAGNEDCTVGYVDKDKMIDLIAFIKNTRGDDRLGQVLISRSTGSGFEEYVLAKHQKEDTQPQLLRFCVGNEVCRVSDVSGDGRADLVAFTRDPNPKRQGYVWFTEQGQPQPKAPYIFINRVVLKTQFCIGEAECTLGDVNGDGKAELISFLRQTRPGDASNHVQIYFPENLKEVDIGHVETWHRSFCLFNEQCLVGNMDGPIDNLASDKKRVDLVAFSSKLLDDGTTEYSMKIALAAGNDFADPPIEFQGDYCPNNDICRIADIDGNGQDDIIAFNRSVSTDKCVSNVRITFLYRQGASIDAHPWPEAPSPTYPNSAPTSHPAGVRSPQPTVNYYLPLTTAPVYCVP